MGFGFGVLRLNSHDFWRMTPRELAFAMRGPSGATLEPFDQTRLRALMDAFPDP